MGRLAGATAWLVDAGDRDAEPELPGDSSHRAGNQLVVAWVEDPDRSKEGRFKISERMPRRTAAYALRR